MLHNAWLPIVYEITASCGRVGYTLIPGPDTTGHSECFLRHKDGGAVAALGATRPNRNDRAHKFDTELYRVSFGDDESPPVTQELGWVINKAKVKMAEQYGWDDITKASVRVYHLLGDPEIDIYTGWNGYISADHLTRTTDEPQTFWVTVYNEENNPLRYALVCLYQESGLHRVSSTNYLGVARFNITPRAGWLLYVTVTKHDYGPYEGTCRVHASPTSPDGPQEEKSSFPFAFNSALYNPQTRSVNITYQLPEKSFVEIRVFDATGRLINIIEKVQKPDGINQSIWNCRDNYSRIVSQGIYFIKLKTGEFEEIRKVVIF